MRARIGAAVTIIFAMLAALAACELVLPTHALDETATVPDAQDPCVHVVPPPPPSVPGGGDIDFFDAVRQLTLNGTDTVGYDLDGVCTCQTGPASCVPFAKGDERCDRDGGRDIEGNGSFGEALEGLLKATGFGDVNDRIAAGRLSYLLQVRHYNGEADDPDVFVGIYVSNGLILSDDDASFRVNFPPSWDGGDPWSVDCALSAATCPNGFIADASALTPGHYDSNAYVSNHVLVARFSAPVVLGLGFTSLTISAPILTATITKVPEGWQLDGQLAGRVSTHEAFVTVSAMHDGDDGGYLCGDAATFQNIVKPTVCKAADIAADPSKDNSGAPCDALSVALPFRASPAGVGWRFDHTPIVRGCDGVIDECRP